MDGLVRSRVRPDPVFHALLTVGKVAALLKVSRATVYRLVERQELLAVRVSNAIRIRHEDLARLIKRA